MKCETLFKKLYPTIFIALAPIWAIAEEEPSAQEKVFDDWSAHELILEEAGFSIARTANDSGAALGFICVEGECELFLNLDLTCEEDGEYPVLVSVAENIYSETLTCKHFVEQQLLFFPADSDVSAEVVLNNELGVAAGIGGIKFRAFYFSLSGSAKAYAVAKVWSKSMLETDIESVSEIY